MGKISSTGMSQKDLVTFLGNVVTMCNGVKTLLNSIRSTLTGDSVIGKAGLAVGTGHSAADVANGAFLYTVNGVLFYKAADAAGTVPGNDVIPQNKYGAVAFDIDAAGSITAVEAAANATGYATAALAAAGLPAVATDKIRMGYVTASKSDGTFTFGTTALNAASTTVAYTDTAGALANVGAAISTSDLSLTV